MKDAISWAVSSLTEALRYEYYLDNKIAQNAAKHMSILSGQSWVVREDRRDIGKLRLWIMPESEEHSHLIPNSSRQLLEQV